MQYRHPRLLRAIYFPPVMAVAIAAAAISALPMLEKAADAEMSLMLAAVDPRDCAVAVSGCDPAEFGEPLVNIEQVVGVLGVETAASVGPEYRNHLFDF